MEIDDKGDVITYEEYHPFGTTSYQATNSAIKAAAKRYRYTGMERDEETGLNYHNARYYIPWLGRWLNPDPIGIGDGVNVYAYCHNNPTTNTDTSGTQVNVTKQDNAKVVKGIDFKTLIQASTKQAVADVAAKSEAWNKQMAAQSNRDKLYGTNDPEYWQSKNPDMASTMQIGKDARKAYDSSSGFAAFSVLFNTFGVPLIGAAAGGAVVAKGIQVKATPYSDGSKVTPLTYSTKDKNTTPANQFFPKSLSTLTEPQGLSPEKFSDVSKALVEKLGALSKDVVVQGSRAEGTAKSGSDIDIAILVSPEKFNELIKQFFGTPNKGSANERTMLKAEETGKIQSGEAKLTSFRIALEKQLGMSVDISIIKADGRFDNGVQLPIKKDPNSL